MDGPWGHYAKWNQSDKERPILYDLTYMCNLKRKCKLIEKEITFVVIRGGVRELDDCGYKLPVIKKNKYMGWVAQHDDYW